jgi:hypothetical protein
MMSEAGVRGLEKMKQVQFIPYKNRSCQVSSWTNGVWWVQLPYIKIGVAENVGEEARHK